MNIIPPKYKAEEISLKGKYTCPLCKVQSTLDEYDAGWVKCPMLENKAICLGCCLDYQSVARSDNFEEHPYNTLFTEEIVQLTDTSPNDLRVICLKHQEELIYKRLSEEEGVFKDRLVNLLQQVQKSLKNM